MFMEIGTQMRGGKKWTLASQAWQVCCVTMNELNISCEEELMKVMMPVLGRG
jgi:hypothetical protein